MICDECTERADTDNGCFLSPGLECPAKCDCQHKARRQKAEPATGAPGE